ncbi:Palmitoyltransferase, DHHC domain, partial [Dillenia turbinata]
MHRSGATMAWNIFKFCTALRGLGSVMILFVLAIIGVTYYSVVLVDYGPSLFSGGLLRTVAALAILLLFHALLVMLLWCYFSVVLTDPGHVPPNWRPSIDMERGEADPLVGSDVQYSTLPPDTRAQRVRFCRKCNQMKPPRCHHCSVCGRCILKMDHHCVWVVNCVGALNYKHFLLFLFYTFLETALVSLSLLPNFVVLFTDGEISGTPGALVATFITFVLNLAFALSILGFLLMHMWLVLANTTTIEVTPPADLILFLMAQAYEKATPKWLYDLGRKKNFEQDDIKPLIQPVVGEILLEALSLEFRVGWVWEGVFGKDKKYWFLPAYSAEDLQMMPELQGLNYPVNPNLDSL